MLLVGFLVGFLAVLLEAVFLESVLLEPMLLEAMFLESVLLESVLLEAFLVLPPVIFTHVKLLSFVVPRVRI